MRRAIRVVAFCVLFAGAASAARAQQVVFSRRVYAATGSTYQELWTWDAASGKLSQLTRSERDHNMPSCSADGKEITFLVGDPWMTPSVWSFERATGAERQVSADARTNQPHAAYSDTFQLSGGGTCLEPRKSPDGNRVACDENMDLVVADALTRSEVGRLRFAERDADGGPYTNAPEPKAWAPDGTRLLVGVYGEYSSSTARDEDYFVVDPATRAWKRAVSGNDALWLPDGRILYTTQRDLTALPAPASAHSVWTQHLMTYDVATGATRAWTSGVTNNQWPVLCGQ